VDAELASCSIQLGLSTKAATAKRLQLRKKPEYRSAEVRIEGFASPELVRRELRSADIVVMPSRMGPFGLVASEAIACGVPFIVSRDSGVAMVMNKYGARSAQLVTTSRNEPHTSDETDTFFDADVEAWATAIVDMIRCSKSAFEDALRLRCTLMEKLTPPYQRMIDQGDAEARIIL
jgi:glycosyltransferase involved in cell wall biosynthesis